ncbi:MAG TPA: hypothetical protein VGI40_18705 [Pirellulaceae bacterium]|jgi:hypothetical protein
MSREEVQRVVIDCIKRVRSMGGYRDAEITADTVPLKDLKDFDSPNGVEVTVLLDVDLGGAFSDGVVSVFTSPDGRKALSVKQITDSVLKLQAAKKRVAV